jgi:outer membrane protein TolC
VQYRLTLITAFQDVADALHAIVSDTAALHAEQVAKRTLDIKQRRQVPGDVGSLVVVTVEQACPQARLTSITVQTNRLGSAVASIGWLLVERDG